MPEDPGARTKIVIRKLPPTLPQQALTEALEKAFPGFSGRTNWLSFVPGKSSLKTVQHARAYVNFNESSDVLKFKAAFDGHAFVSERGTQFRCAVEYAPYQKVPRATDRADPREGTIEKDAEYQAFLEQLSAGPGPVVSAETRLQQREAEARAAGGGIVPGPSVTVTPLMAFLQDRKAAAVAAKKTAGSKARADKKKKDVKVPPAPKPAPCPPPPAPVRTKSRKAPGSRRESTDRTASAQPPVAAVPAAKPAPVAGTRAASMDKGRKAEARSKQPSAPAVECSAGIEKSKLKPEQPAEQSKKQGKPRSGDKPKCQEQNGREQRSAAPSSSVAADPKQPAVVQRQQPLQVPVIKQRSQVKQPEQAPAAAPQPEASSSERPAAAAPSGEQKPVEGPAASDRAPRKVRVRQGFEAFQPKRFGRLTGDGADAAPSAARPTAASNPPTPSTGPSPAPSAPSSAPSGSQHRAHGAKAQLAEQSSAADNKAPPAGAKSTGRNPKARGGRGKAQPAASADPG